MTNRKGNYRSFNGLYIENGFLRCSPAAMLAATGSAISKGPRGPFPVSAVGIPRPRLRSGRSPGNRLPAIAFSGSPHRLRHFKRPSRAFSCLRRRHSPPSLTLRAFAGQSPAGDCFFRLTPPAPPFQKALAGLFLSPPSAFPALAYAPGVRRAIACRRLLFPAHPTGSAIPPPRRNGEFSSGITSACAGIDASRKGVQYPHCTSGCIPGRK